MFWLGGLISNTLMMIWGRQIVQIWFERSHRPDLARQLCCHVRSRPFNLSPICGHFSSLNHCLFNPLYFFLFTCPLFSFYLSIVFFLLIHCFLFTYPLFSFYLSIVFFLLIHCFLVTYPLFSFNLFTVFFLLIHCFLFSY